MPVSDLARPAGTPTLAFAGRHKTLAVGMPRQQLAPGCHHLGKQVGMGRDV